MQINNLNSNQNFDGYWMRKEYSEIKPAPLINKLGVYYVTEDVYCPNQSETQEEIAKALSKPPFWESGNTIKKIDSASLRFREHKVSVGPRLSD